MIDARYRHGFPSTRCRRTLVTFLLMLWDYALVDAKTMDACLRLYDGVAPSAPATTAGGGSGPPAALPRKPPRPPKTM